MQAIWIAVAQFFATLTTLFSAAEKVASTLNNVAGVGEMKSATYYKEAQHDQEVAVEEFAFARDMRKAELDKKRAALKANATAAVGAPKATKAIAAPAP